MNDYTFQPMSEAVARWEPATKHYGGCAGYSTKTYTDRNGVKWIEYISEDAEMLQYWGRDYARFQWGYSIKPIAGGLHVLLIWDLRPPKPGQP